MMLDFERGVTLDLSNAEEISKALMGILDGGFFSVAVIDVFHRDPPRLEEHRKLTDAVGPRRKKIFTTLDRQSNYAHIGLTTNVESWSISNSNKARVTITDHIVTIEQVVDGTPVIWNLAPEPT